jgi:hypothetical protein
MFCPKKLSTTALALVVVTATSAEPAVGQTGRARRQPLPSAAAPSAKVSRVPGGLSTSAGLMYRYVKSQRIHEFDWEQVPWLTDLHEAVRQAKAENRPILLWTTDDDPLERC